MQNMVTQAFFCEAMSEWSLVDWFARSIGSSLGVITAPNLLVAIITKDSLLFNLRCCDALNAMVFGVDGSDGVEFFQMMQYYFTAYEMYLVYKKYKLYQKGDYSVAYDLYQILEQYTRGQLKALVYLNGGTPPSKRFNRKVDWAIAFMETSCHGFETFGIDPSDLRVSLQTYTRDELEALVYRNHGQPPHTDGKLYWSLAYLNTRRYGFNTFGMRTSLHGDMLFAIREFL